MSPVLPVGAQQLLPELDPSVDPAVIEALTNAGRTALSKGDEAAARRAYEELLLHDRNSAEALYQLAVMEFKKRNYLEGIELVKRAIAAAPDNPTPRLALARALGEVGKENEAIQEYEQTISTMGPGTRQAESALLELNMLKFRLATRMKNREQIRFFGESMINSPALNPKVLEIVATIYARASLFEEAANAYEKLLLMQPKNPAAEFYLAGVYERLRKPRLAMKHYELAIKKGDDDEGIRRAKINLGILRAFSYLAEEDRERAHKEFVSVLELDEMHVLANMNVAGYLQQQNDFQGAKQHYLNVLKVQPENLDARFRLAIVYLDMADPLEAVRALDYILVSAPGSPAAQAAQEALDKASRRWSLNAVREVLAEEAGLMAKLQQTPGDAATILALGALKLRQGKPEEAVKYFEEAVAVDKSFADAHLQLGLFYDNTGKLEKAVPAYRSALELSSEEEREKIENLLLIAEAQLHLQNKELDQAEKKFREAYERVPDETKLLWGLAVVNSEQGDLEEAVEWYLKVIEKHPAHTRARMNLAFLYQRLEEEELAIAQYKAVSLLENISPEMRQSASDRVDYLQRQINGFSYAVGYSIGVNDNLNSARSNKYYDYRSDLFAGLYYKYKLKKGVKLSVNVTPSYSIYHRSQNDYFNFTVSPSLLFTLWDYDWNFGMSRNTQSSVLRPEQSSTVSDTLTGGASWAGEEDLSYRFSMSYRGFGSSNNPFFDANTINLGLNLSEPMPDNAYLSYGYSLVWNENKNDLGNDYAYTGHMVNGRVDKRFDGNLSGYLDGRLGLNLYKNPDSATSFQRKRYTINLGIGAGVNYRLDTWISYYVGYRYSTQYANLPVSFIYNEQQSIEGQQSASLGSFSSHSINTGIRMNF